MSIPLTSSLNSTILSIKNFLDATIGLPVTVSVPQPLNTTKLADSKFKSIQKLNYKKLQFTDTEIAIINLLSIGYNINQAADIINLNVHTAKKYLYENIRNKILPFVDTDDFNSDYFKIVLRYVSTILPMSTLFLTKTIII